MSQNLPTQSSSVSSFSAEFNFAIWAHNPGEQFVENFTPESGQSSCQASLHGFVTVAFIQEWVRLILKGGLQGINKLANESTHFKCTCEHVISF